MAKRDRRGKLDAYELAILRGGNQTFELSAEGEDAPTEDGSPPPLRPLKVGRFKVGSLGLLVELHHAGLLPSVEGAIRAMQQKGIFLAPNLIETTLRAAAEARTSKE